MHQDFIYVAGSFNNWQPTSTFAMKKILLQVSFWLELTDLPLGKLYISILGG
jgi:hypothetical protein